jgi:hypothetical protein
MIQVAISMILLIQNSQRKSNAITIANGANTRLSHLALRIRESKMAIIILANRCCRSEVSLPLARKQPEMSVCASEILSGRLE